MSAGVALATAEAVDVNDVIVGERARKDYGDLSDLMASIREHGLLQPIGLAPGNHLLFGGRRLEAVRRLGMSQIAVTRPSTQTDALSLLKAERDENTCRKDMTPSEMVALGMQIEEMERPAAEARKAATQLAGRDKSGAPVMVGGVPRTPTEDPKPQRTADVVADALGTSGPSYKRMKHVFTTAHNEGEAPEVREVAKVALADLDAGKASPRGAYERVREVRNGEDIRRKSRPEPVRPPAPPRYGGNRRKHLQVIQSMTTALGGLIIAADEITALDSTVTREEAAHLTHDLSKQIKSLKNLNDLLKERTR